MHLDDYQVAAPLVTELVNSGSEVMGAEQLDRPEVAGELLADVGLTLQRRPDVADLAALHALRERLRGVIAATVDGLVAAGVADLGDLVGEVAASPRLARGERGWAWVVDPVDDRPATVAGVVTGTGLLALIRRLGPERLGRCAKDGCPGMFADSSRPGSRRYCTPARCGNRINVAAFRARQRDGE